MQWWVLVVLVFSLHCVSGKYSCYKPLCPPAVPLAVRSPYVSTWINTRESKDLHSRWPMFWTGQEITWSGLIRVDGTTYEFLGKPASSLKGKHNLKADVKLVELSASSSIFILEAGKIRMNVTFSSPITLTSDQLFRQSLPLSYMKLDFQSVDSKAHSVQVYGDVDGSWATGDYSDMAMSWETALMLRGKEPTISHGFKRKTQLLFSEHNDRAEWGTAYYTTKHEARVTYQIADSQTIRRQFSGYGHLNINNSKPVDSPTFGFAHDVGNVRDHHSSNSVLYTIGVVQDPVAQFIRSKHTETQEPLWKSKFHSHLEAVNFHFNDFSYASQLGQSFDERLIKDSVKISEEYAAITSLSALQTIGATTLTMFNNGSAYALWFKEISSDGNMQTVDVLYPFLPFLLWANPDLLKLALRPLFEYQAEQNYPKRHCIHDLGSNYPNATGHPDGLDEFMPVEESGNMVIMALALAQTGDLDLINKYYVLLKQWSTYLQQKGLIVESQVSTDDFAGPLANQTNLALKAIVGLGAMTDIARMTDHADDAKHFGRISLDYIKRWEELTFANSSLHAQLSYHNPESWGTLYNAFGDKLLNLNLVDPRIIDIQEKWYRFKAERFGVPLDSRNMYTKSDWAMHVAALSRSNITRHMLISKLFNWMNETCTDRPMTDLFMTTGDGDFPGIRFMSRPVIGGHFALLVLK